MTKEADIFSIYEARAYIQDGGSLTFDDIDADEGMFIAKVALFKQLTGVADSSDWRLHETAEKDVREDVNLFLMLTGPIDEFARWFAREDWSIYELYGLTGADEWAGRALAAAWEGRSIHLQ